MSSTSRAAILGLGLIGSAWAEHLKADGILTATWNRSPRPDAPLFEADLEIIPSRAEILHLVVADERAATSVIERIELIVNCMPKMASRMLSAPLQQSVVGWQRTVVRGLTRTRSVAPNFLTAK